MKNKSNMIFNIDNDKIIKDKIIENNKKIKDKIIENNKKINVINIFTSKKCYHLHNSHHLGDNVFNLVLFYMIKNYIETNNIFIYYYAKDEYLSQLKEFVCSKNILLNSLNLKPKISIEIWINNDFFGFIHEPKVQNISYNNFYKIFFTKVLMKLNINLSIEKLYYIDEDLINRYDNIPAIYKDFDILILNSAPLSGQYNLNKQIWDNYIIILSKHFKVLTTTKVEEVLCTFDDKLTIKDIASLSTKSKVIIAINSGVVPGLLNIYTLTNIKHFYIFDDRCYYSYPNFENKQNITDITVDELKKYIN
jgi:hypothetical protein